MINVNLLPEEIKREIYQTKRNSRAQKALIKLVAILFVAILFYAGAGIFIGQTLEIEKNRYEQSQKNIFSFGNLQEESQKIAEKLNTIKKIKSGGSVWSGVITEINQIVPAGIYLNSIKMDANKKIRAQITGHAVSKNEVASFREKLEKSSLFEYVDIESSTTQTEPSTKREIENFTLTLSLSKESLK